MLGKNHKLNFTIIAAMNLNRTFLPAETEGEEHPQNIFIAMVRWNGNIIMRQRQCKAVGSRGMMSKSKKSKKSNPAAVFNEHVMIWVPMYRDIRRCVLEVMIFGIVPHHPLENGPMLGCVELSGDQLYDFVFPVTPALSVGM